VDQALERRRRMTRRPVAGHQYDQKRHASPEHRQPPSSNGYECPRLLELAQAMPTNTPTFTTLSQAMAREEPPGAYRNLSRATSPSQQSMTADHCKSNAPATPLSHPPWAKLRAAMRPTTSDMSVTWFGVRGVRSSQRLNRGESRRFT